MVDRCPRCDHALDGGDCPDDDCAYVDIGDDWVSDVGIIRGVFRGIVVALWPNVREMGVLLTVVSPLVWYLYAAPIVPSVLGLFLGLSLLEYDPPTACPNCRGIVEDDDGFCWNCGDAVDETRSLVDENRRSIFERSMDGLDRKFPSRAVVEARTLPSFTVTYAGHPSILDRVTRRGGAWRAFFAIGAVFFAGLFIAVTGGSTALLAEVVNAAAYGSLGGPGGDTSTALPSLGWWLVPVTVNLSIAFLASIVVHEIGHATSSAAFRREIEEVAVSFFGPVPNGGWVKYRDDEWEDYIAAVITFAAGAWFNFLSAVPVAAALLWVYPDVVSLGVVGIATAPAAIAIPGMFAIISVVGAGANAVPLPGSDGGHFLAASMEYVVGGDDDLAATGTAATIVGLIATAALFGLFFV